MGRIWTFEINLLRFNRRFFLLFFVLFYRGGWGRFPDVLFFRQNWYRSTLDFSGYGCWFCFTWFCFVRPRPHSFFFVWRRILFDAFLPLVHSKTTKNADKNGHFENFKSGAFWERVVLKTLRFQCEQVKTEAFENGSEKKASFFIFSISIFGLFGRFSGDSKQKRIKKFAFSFENGLVWTWEYKTKTLV